MYDWSLQSGHGQFQHADYSSRQLSIHGEADTAFEIQENLGPITTPFPKLIATQARKTCPPRPLTNEPGAHGELRSMPAPKSLPPLLPRTNTTSPTLRCPSQSMEAIEVSEKLGRLSNFRLVLPARRGGRKGPMSEKQKRMLAPKRSACMRCRRMRIKVRNNF